MKQQKIIIFCFLFLLSCNKQNKEETGGIFTVDNDVITVAEGAPLLQNIEIGEVETKPFSHKFSVSGEVRPLPECYAEIASPFAGRIVKAFVHAGQRVSEGSPVFEISSPDFFDAGKSYFQAKQEMELARKTFERQRDLFSHNAASTKDLEEAETDYELKTKDFEQAQSALKVWRVEPKDLESGKPLIVRSPIAGEVVKAEITIGQYIKDDAEALAVVANLARVRVIAHVREKDIPFLENINAISVSPTAQPNVQIEAKLCYSGAVLDAETRTVDVIVECENGNRLLKPNMFASVDFTGNPTESLAVPESAVLQSEEGRYVIVSEGNNRFRKQPVTLEAESDSLAIISAGIKAGEKIVTKGAFYFIEAR